MTIYEHDGKVEEADNFDTAVEKISQALKGHINEVYPVYKLFCEMPQGKLSFTDWYPKVLEQARLCNFEGYDATKAARDAMVIQTSNHKLRKKALAEGNDFSSFCKYGIAMEASTAQADINEKTEDMSVSRIKEETRKKAQYRPPTRSIKPRMIATSKLHYNDCRKLESSSNSDGTTLFSHRRGKFSNNAWNLRKSHVSI